jgi:hypothetical protein
MLSTGEFGAEPVERFDRREHFRLTPLQLFPEIVRQRSRSPNLEFAIRLGDKLCSEFAAAGKEGVYVAHKSSS